MGLAPSGLGSPSEARGTNLFHLRQRRVMVQQRICWVSGVGPARLPTTERVAVARRVAIQRNQNKSLSPLPGGLLPAKPIAIIPRAPPWACSSGG